jgi:hypothetical protein
MAAMRDLGTTAAAKAPVVPRSAAVSPQRDSRFTRQFLNSSDEILVA